jgi:hypothetical protein
MTIVIDEKYDILFNENINFKELIDSHLERYTWELDTPEIRERINSEIDIFLKPYLRNKKIEFLLD